MDEKIIISIVAALSAILGGLITSILAPIIKHWLEQSITEKSRKRELIVKWRNMILEIAEAANGDINPTELIQRHRNYFSLEPHLSNEAKKIARAENRTIVVGNALSLPLEALKNEIARIEKDWNLT